MVRGCSVTAHAGGDYTDCCEEGKYNGMYIHKYTCRRRRRRIEWNLRETVSRGDLSESLLCVYCSGGFWRWWISTDASSRPLDSQTWC